MPNGAIAEVYFIAAMMILICVICAAAVFVFFRQLKREKNSTKITRKKPAEKEKDSEQEYVSE